MQGVLFLSAAVRSFEESGSLENKKHFINTLCLWWGSMIDATLIHYPEAMCTAVKDLANELKGDRYLLRSRVKSGLKEEVCVCIHLCVCACMHVCVCIHVCEYACACVLVFNYANIISAE